MLIKKNKLSFYLKNSNLNFNRLCKKTIGIWLFLFFVSYSLLGQNTNKDTSYVKKFNFIYYEYKIEELDKTSPIKLDYNDYVQQYIDKYLNERLDKISEFLSLKDLYFPIFEEYLDKYNLPLELKYLPIVESGLDPKAQSPSGAIGLWQLLYNPAVSLGLKINSYYDERCDVYLSTDAACRYLKYLYSLFNDWQLVLAAYNGGPGEVRNAIERSGGKKNYWVIRPYLSQQAQNYVPAFIAVFYLVNFAKEHGIKPNAINFNFKNIDTLHVTSSVNFAKVTKYTNTDLDILRKLNPSYRTDYIPAIDKYQILVLPSDKVLSFLRNEKKIYFESDSLSFKKVVNNDSVEKVKTVYEVKKGDFLHKIALENECTVDDIMNWNKLTDKNLKIGQKLTIWIVKNDQKNVKYFYYTVKKGDTIYSIAEKFNCDSINDIIRVNNITSSEIKEGQKLRIRVVEN